MARSIDWHWFKQFLIHRDNVHSIQSFEDFYCFRMYTSIQHWSCFDFWVANFLHMLLQTCMESQVFGTSSTFIHTALVTQIFLDVFSCYNLKMSQRIVHSGLWDIFILVYSKEWRCPKDLNEQLDIFKL
jgi:hypothetical protein